MNRDENLAMWKRIAAGELSGREQWDEIDTWDWIRGVAEKVIQADEEPTPNCRIAAIVAAVGLRGKLDTYAALRYLIEQLTMFFPIDDDGNDIPRTQGQVIAGIVDQARKQGLLNGVYADDDKKAKDLIRDILHQRI
jgi:hypothetical protein